MFLLTLACSTDEPAPAPPTEVGTTISAITTTGFTLTFTSAAVPGLAATELTLDKDATIDSVEVVPESETIAANSTYTVATSTLKVKEPYVLTINKGGYTVSINPISFVVPDTNAIILDPKVIEPSKTSFVITFDKAVDLQASELSLSMGGTVTAVTSATPDATKMIYTIVTSELTADATYEIVLKKSGYAFKTTPLTFKVPADDIAVQLRFLVLTPLVSLSLSTR